MRPTRRKLAFDEASLNNLIQELYDDSHNIKAKITRLFTKWEDKVKEGGEIAAFGDAIIKLIAAEAKNQDQKIMLLKYLKEIVSEKNGGGNAPKSEKEEKELDSNERNELLQYIKKQTEENSKRAV